MSHGAEQITSRTLLERVRDPGDGAAWREFHDLYAPLLLQFARARGLAIDDAEEVRDDCLALLARKLQAFLYDRNKGGFKGWLFRIAQARATDALRRVRHPRLETGQVDAVRGREVEPEEAWERAWRVEHLRFALAKAEERVSERTYQAFQLLLIEGASVQDVCTRMGMAPDHVYKAKARALAAVRAILEQHGTDGPEL